MKLTKYLHSENKEQWNQWFSQCALLSGSKRIIMTEFRDGFFRLIKKIIGGSSVSLALIYTLGHIIIAMTCNRIITGADWGLASIDAVIEPCINGVWFYFLHEFWRKLTKNPEVTVFKKSGWYTPQWSRHIPAWTGLV